MQVSQITLCNLGLASPCKKRSRVGFVLLLLHGIGLYPSLLRIKSKLGAILSIMNICSASVQSVERALSLYHMTDTLNVNNAAISHSSLTLPRTATNSELQRVAHSIAYREGRMVVMSYLLRILMIVFLTAFGQIYGLNQNVMAEWCYESVMSMNGGDIFIDLQIT